MYGEACRFTSTNELITKYVEDGMQLAQKYGNMSGNTYSNT